MLKLNALTLSGKTLSNFIFHYKRAFNLSLKSAFLMALFKALTNIFKNRFLPCQAESDTIADNRCIAII